MISVLHVSDVHIGAGFRHGKINPITGVNTRLEDFINALAQAIDVAIKDDYDLVLFGGDAFPDSTPAPYIHCAFARQMQRLAEANIPTVLLEGNHDQHSHGVGGSSLSIFKAISSKFIVGDSIATHRIKTKNGDVQVITIPWITSSVLRVKEEARGKSLEEQDSLLLEEFTRAYEAEIANLDTTIPTVTLAHAMVTDASLGAERFLAVSKGFSIPVDRFIYPPIDYVALGHIHKHQDLNPNSKPPVVYPGSIERVDFSEEHEDKGFVTIELTRGNAEWKFHPVPARPFLTIEIDVSESDAPELDIITTILDYNTIDKVVRVIYKVTGEQLGLINTSNIVAALDPAHKYFIHPEIVKHLSDRPRVPELDGIVSLDTIGALELYCQSQKRLKDIAGQLLEAAQDLLREPD